MPSIMRSINVISRCATVYRADRLPDSEITPCHHVYIFAICKHPGISQEQLARHICINKSTVTRTLSYLEDHGYVTRRQSETDKRITKVFPTQKMFDIHPKIKAISDDWNAYLCAELSEEERAGFGAILEKLQARAQKYIDTKDEQKT